MGTTTVQGKTYKVNDWELETLCERTEALPATQLQVVRQIVFPQTEPGPQRKFVFEYNSDTTENVTTSVNWTCNGGYVNYTRAASVGWGELSRVVSPPGDTQNSAYSDYTYQLNSEHSLEFSTDEMASNSISSKELHHDGIVDTWNYNISENITGVTSPDGSWLDEWRYCATWGTPNCSTDKAGLAYRITRPFVMTEKHWINLAFSGADVIKPGGVVSFNPVVDYEYTTLLDAANNPLKMAAKAFQYDYNGNVTQTTEYDWFDPNLVSRDAQGVPTGVPGSATVLRVTNHSHYNQAAGSTSANVYAKRSVSTGTPLILNAPQQTTVGPSIAQFSYDGQAYGVAPTVGNLTTKKVWVDLDTKWITTSNTYGSFGNLATSSDARGKVTQFFYDDATHALPNRVVVDPQNGTGTQTTTTAFDYHTSAVTSQTDVNGQVSTIDYTNQLLGVVDPFGRPGITKSPVINIGGTNHRHRVTTTYLDSARQIIVETDLNAENDKLLKTRTTVDMLGRPVLTEATEDGTNYTISVKNAYLNMGQVTLASSPMRGTAANTDSWTRVKKDIAGRVTEVATFGGATQPGWSGTGGAFTGAVTTAYSANFTTVTDPAGKVRRSMVDALGRLTRVDEPDGSGNLGSTTAPVQPTGYAYSVLDNLTTVTQGSQTRTFTYDSLSRLRSAVNPESATINYQYDDNGSLLVKTDARGVSAHYEYDSLNRVKRRWYNGSNSISATTHNSPALPSGVGATDEVKFYYDTQALPTGAPSYARGSAVGRLVAQSYGTGSNGDYYAYDVLGRATLKFQQTGTINYQLGATYTLSGAVSSLSYPSGRTITSTYDQAGRLTGFSGNLGDGVSRTYSNGILYSPPGGLLKEQFGTATPVYNKLFYNSRGQLAEIRTSTSYTGPTDTTWNRGAIINHYSDQCWGMCSGAPMPDNNGNLKKQEVYIPHDDQVSSYTMRWQQYDYDSLNRLNWVREVLDGGGEQWKQQFTYDRWGNRTINTAVTYGTGINNKAFTVNTANNRLGVPGGQSGVMSYDAAGNLTNDTYTGAGNRTYDAENKITSAWGGNNQAQLYKYDAAGQRIKRTVDGVETWQVYGFGGELAAEYAAGGTATNPQKEYGYRNGQLLIVASVAGGDHSLSLNGTSAYAQGLSSSSLSIAGAITVEAWIKINAIGAYRAIVSKEAFQQAGTGGGYRLAITDLGKVRLDLFQSHNTYTTVIGASTVSTGVWHHVAGVFDGNQMRVYLNGVLDGTISSANGPATGTGGFYLGRFSYINNPYYFNGLIDEARVSNAALYSSNFTPPASLSASGSTKGLWKFNGQTAVDFSINGNNGTLQGGATYSGNVPGGGGSSVQFQWLVTDHLGTPRMTIDQTGSLANVKRHDYLPFGEELFAPVGGRSAAMGYTSGDGVRQQFTLKERDIETGLDYFLARYYSSTQGRFTSPDHFDGNPAHLLNSFERSSALPYATLLNPQTINLYQYAYNSPLSYVDPDGHQGGRPQPLPNNRRYTIRADFNNPHDSPNVHVFDKNGKREIGRVALKGTPENHVYEWSGKVPPRVQADVEAFIREKGAQPRPPLHPRGPAAGTAPRGGGVGGFRANSLGVLAYVGIFLNAYSQYANAQQFGYYFNYRGQMVIDDLSKAVQNLPQGQLVKFEGVIFKLKGDTFVAIDPSCVDCKLRQDKDGNLYIEGCKRCAED